MSAKQPPNNEALLVIDLQTGMFSGGPLPPIYNADVLVERVRTVIDWARRTGRKVAFIRHDATVGDSLAPGEPGWPLWPALGRADDEPVFSKSVDDAFSQPLLVNWIAEHGVREVILAGAQSDQCVAATVNGALACGVHVTVVADAHSTWDFHGETADQIIARHNVSFAAAGATVTDTEVLTRSQHGPSSG